MTSLDTIRTAIAATLSSVADIGCVHDYERYADREAAFRELYQATLASGDTKLRGWFVRRTATRTVAGAVTGVAMRVDTWQIRGYDALQDAVASEKTFDDLLESIVTAFLANETLGSTVADVCDLTAGDGPKETGIQIVESLPVLFGGVLCHSARLSLVTSSAVIF